MHREAEQWLQRQVYAAPELKGRRTIDIGGRNVNGSIKGIFQTDDWSALDHVDGKGVDIVGDLRDYVPTEPYDLVVCTEVAEHLEAEDLIRLVQTVWRCCSSIGVVLLTAACDPRLPHTATGKIIKGPWPDGEPYNNVDPEELHRLSLRYFDAVKVEVDRNHGDVYMKASKPLGVREEQD